MAKKILVLSASVGAGHIRAAQALELALKELAPPDDTIQNVDVLTLSTASFRKIYRQSYLEMVNKAPHLLGFFYDRLDQPVSKSENWLTKLGLVVEKANLKGLVKLLQEPWDLVVNTHYLPTEILASMRRKQQSKLEQFCVTTDFDTHRLWVHDPVERYFCALEDGKKYLESFGVPEKKITVTGIPIHPVFSKPKDRVTILKAHGIQGDRPVILQLAGGFGVGPVGDIYKSLLEIQQPLEIVVVAGKNEDAQKALKKIKVPPRHLTHILGFTDKMDELLVAADVVLSKPGGLTVSEALARGAAFAILNPIPGQETHNSDYLLENGAAIKIQNIPTLQLKLGALLADKERLASLKRNAARISHPDAAYVIAREALAWK